MDPPKRRIFDMSPVERILEIFLGTTPQRFIMQPMRIRTAVFQSYFVQEEYVRIEERGEDGSFSSKLANTVLLWQECMKGVDETGKQLVREVYEIYYQQNTFIVRSHLLCEFMNTLANKELVAIESLVRKIMVQVDIEHIHAMDDFTCMPEGETEKSWVMRGLRPLLEFTNATGIGIEIIGEGAVDGSDLRTQQTIKDMSWIVKELIDKFGEAFSIRKVAPKQLLYHNLRPYWNPPLPMAKEKLQEGLSTFGELMQIQIGEWTRDEFENLQPKNRWESLL